MSRRLLVTQQPEQVAFMTTRWSCVLSASDLTEPEAGAAMAQLCQDYWYPLYAFARRRGLGVHDAQDATQGFFSHLVEVGSLRRARSDLGRFRTFLMGAMQHFLSNERRHLQTQKRGGSAVIVSFDEMHAEERFAAEPEDMMTPEVQFERSWAFALIERVFLRLGEDYSRAGRGDLFEKLRPFLSADSARPGYEAVARELAMSAGAVGTAIHRMRRRYGELMREEISHTVATYEEVEQEIAYLIEVVGRG